MFTFADVSFDNGLLAGNQFMGYVCQACIDKYNLSSFAKAQSKPVNGVTCFVEGCDNKQDIVSRDLLLVTLPQHFQYSLRKIAMNGARISPPIMRPFTEEQTSKIVELLSKQGMHVLVGHHCIHVVDHHDTDDMLERIEFALLYMLEDNTKASVSSHA